MVSPFLRRVHHDVLTLTLDREVILFVAAVEDHSDRLTVVQPLDFVCVRVDILSHFYFSLDGCVRVGLRLCGTDAVIDERPILHPDDFTDPVDTQAPLIACLENQQAHVSLPRLSLTLKCDLVLCLDFGALFLERGHGLNQFSVRYCHVFNP